jgi:hypothetical protein
MSSVPVSRSGPRSTAFRVGWLVLVVAAALGVIAHGTGVFVIAQEEPEPLMFAAFAATNAYALVVLLVPYRRLERWAWAVTWINVAATGMVFVWLRDGVGFSYLVGAVVMALAQVATYPDFRRRSHRSRTAGAEA